MDGGNVDYALDGMLKKLSSHADRISTALDGLKKTDTVDSSIDEFLKKLSSLEEPSAPKETSEQKPDVNNIDEKPLPEKIEEPNTAAVNALTGQYLDELEMRDSVISRQTENLQDLRLQIYRQQDLIQNLQHMLLDLQWQIAQINFYRLETQTERSYPQNFHYKPAVPALPPARTGFSGPAEFPATMEDRPRVPAEPIRESNILTVKQEPDEIRYQDLPPAYPEEQTAPPAVEEDLDGIPQPPDDIIQQQQPPTQPDEQVPLPEPDEPEQDEAVEKVEEPPDVEEILRKGSGAKLYDL